jgi:hypothetical protein
LVIIFLALIEELFDRKRVSFWGTFFVFIHDEKILLNLPKKEESGNQ